MFYFCLKKALRGEKNPIALLTDWESKQSWRMQNKDLFRGCRENQTMAEWKYICEHEYIVLTQDCGTLPADGCLKKKKNEWEFFARKATLG